MLVFVTWSQIALPVAITVPIAEQKMADLPKGQVTPAPPFTYTGVDYFGP